MFIAVLQFINDILNAANLARAQNTRGKIVTTNLDSTNGLWRYRSEPRVSRSDGVGTEAFFVFRVSSDFDVEMESGSDEINMLGHMLRQMVA